MNPADPLYAFSIAYPWYNDIQPAIRVNLYVSGDPNAPDLIIDLDRAAAHRLIRQLQSALEQ